MTRKILIMTIMTAALIFVSSCAANKESQAVRQVEQQQARDARKADREHKKMVRQHYKKQKKETRKALQNYKRRAKKMNRPKRYHPYLWNFQSS